VSSPATSRFTSVGRPTARRSRLRPAARSSPRRSPSTTPYPWFRVFARNNSGQAASLKIEILYLDTTGKLRTRASGVYTAHASGWAPTGTLKIPMTFDPTTAAGAAPVAFRFTPQGLRSSWQIDDVYVDPMARR
jgi:hypothetical protein